MSWAFASTYPFNESANIINQQCFATKIHQPSIYL